MSRYPQWAKYSSVTGIFFSLVWTEATLKYIDPQTAKLNYHTTSELIRKTKYSMMTNKAIPTNPQLYY